MEYQEINQNLSQVFRKVFKNDELILLPEFTAQDVEGWDSLTHMILITEIEDCFGLKFKLKELNKMHNVGQMLEIIQSKVN